MPKEIAAFLVPEAPNVDAGSASINTQGTDDIGTGVGSADTQRGGNWKSSTLKPGGHDDRPVPDDGWVATEWMETLL